MGGCLGDDLIGLDVIGLIWVVLFDLDWKWVLGF